MNLRAISSLVLICLGCASKAPPPAAPVQAVAKSEAVVAEPAPDLSPVAAPDDLVLVGRFARPRVVVDTLMNWVGVPLRVTDLLPAELRSAQSVVAWDAPLEVAAIFDRHSTSKVPSPVVVVSLGLTSLSGALDLVRGEGLSATRVAPGVHRVRIDDQVTCAVAASLGKAPARLICGGDWDGMEDLLPYATRGLPNEKLGSSEDVFLELRAAPLQRRYSQEIASVRLLTGLLLRQGQTDNPRVDRALTDIAYAVADELKAVATDLDKLQISLRLDEANKVLELGSSLSFAKTSSQSAQYFAELGARSAVPPEAFWGLPRSATQGSFGVKGSEKLASQIAAAGAELMDAYLEHRKASAALRRRARGVIEALPAATGSAAYVGGSVEVPQQASALERWHARLGWSVGVGEVRAEKLTKPLIDVEAVLGDRFLKAELGTNAKKLVKAKHRVVRAAGFPAAGMAFTVEAPPGLFSSLEEQEPTDAASKKAKPDKGGVAAVLVLVPDGERTWYALAPDEKTALAKLELARSGQGGTLKDIPELAPLASAKCVGGGFTTLEGLLSGIASALERHAPDFKGALAAAPHHGRSPHLLRWDSAATGTGVVSRLSWRMPKAAFEDIGAAIPFLMPKGE